jgi:predicted solute-binding protein
MYEVLEHWKQYKLEQKQSKELFNECGFQYKKEGYKQMDKFLNKLSKKNGTTKY